MTWERTKASVERELNMHVGKALWQNLITNLGNKLRNRKRIQTRNQEERKEIKMQNEFRVQLNTIDRVKRFVKICDNYEEDIDLGSGRYIIDAKSIMGIFSFDLTKPLNIRIHSNNDDVVRRFNEEMSEYRYDD